MWPEGEWGAAQEAGAADSTSAAGKGQSGRKEEQGGTGKACRSGQGAGVQEAEGREWKEQEGGKPRGAHQAGKSTAYAGIREGRGDVGTEEPVKGHPRMQSVAK